jgi:hypothetical protein
MYIVCGHFGIFFPVLVQLDQEKSGNPARNRLGAKFSKPEVQPFVETLSIIYSNIFSFIILLKSQNGLVLMKLFGVIQARLHN